MGLFDMLGAGSARRSGGMSPVTMALLGVLAYRTLKGKGRLADMLGTGALSTSPQVPGAGSPGGMPGDQGTSAGGLGGLLGGGALGSGLRDLLDRFRGTPHEQAVQSWVAKGPNHSIAPHELEQTLGEERIQWLMEQTGLPRDQLLSGLSRELPAAVDQLTPDGRVPTDEELKHVV